MMSSDSIRLSHLLRHGAIESGLDMDGAGWAHVGDVLTVLSMTESELDSAIATNTKGRLQRNGDLVRACQGHSFDGTPVTLEALEASWEADNEDFDLWHGTNEEALPGIREFGLLAGRRTHVHLAASIDARVGKRTNVHVLLRVARDSLRANKIIVWRAPNGVLLVRAVPPQCIVEERFLAP
jgi:putative RNA 2'-phosphotransferase